MIAADHEPRSPGFGSRYTAQRVRYPDPAAAPDAAVEALRRAAGDLRIDLIIPVSQELVLLLAGARRRFDGVCAVAVPDAHAHAVVSDKRATLELARRIGVPTPRSALVHTTEEAQAVAPVLGWPVVVKPAASRVYRHEAIEAFQVGYAEGPGALAGETAALAGRCPILRQEYRPREGHGVGVRADRGRPLAVLQPRRRHGVTGTGVAS